MIFFQGRVTMTLTFDRSNGETYSIENRIFPMTPVKSSYKNVPFGGLSGICPVCGFLAVFDGFTDNERETGACSICAASNRQRQMAKLIRTIYNLKEEGAFCFPTEFNLYNTESTGPLHTALATAIPRYTCSEYFGYHVERGANINGVLHQDMQNFTFLDNQFDLILSSDVMEHIPNPYDAHREIFRILKSGGRHIFTVPFYPWEALDEVRAIERDGQTEYLNEEMYHSDPVRPEEGILVYTIFGLQMIVTLASIGFIVSYWNLHDPAQGIIGPWSIVFDARKP
jgi:SAM-dependent methyltransferase